MAAAPKAQRRYQLIDHLGQGGMGIVYRGHDTTLDRAVAIKTLKESPDQTAIDQFRKECDVQKSLHHPNIIEIYDYDVADLDGTGTRKPYLVMPLIEGRTLDELIREASPRLTVENVVEMMIQVCRGMQAAHDRGLVHRDLKPSNLFVLEDNSVKIIDFGVAHLVDQKSSVGIKGTPLYMSPEQIRMEAPTPLSDIFSLGVVCYETLTGRRPFEATGRDDVIQRILKENPPPAHTLNPAVNMALSQVVHAAMAKQPYNRFASAREFADALKKALRNEPIERFNPARVQPRLEKSRKAIEQGDYELAEEIIGGLEAESCIHPEVEALRRQVDRAVRSRVVRQLLDSARKRFAEQLLDLAYQKVQEALHIDPGNLEAIELKAGIDSQRNEQQIQEWFNIARQHIDNHAYKLAKQALQNVINLKPEDTQARQLLSEAEHRESEYLKVRKRKESLYKAAYQNWQRGEVSSALSKIEEVVDLDHDWPDASGPDVGPGYQDLYNQVRSAHESIKNAYEAARRHLSEQNFEAAANICQEYRAKYPQHALFQGLEFDIEERKRQALAAFIARVDKEVDQEPDLNRKVAILEEAHTRHPVAHFEQSLNTTRARRDLVNAMVAKARALEDSGQFAEAIGQWEILRTLHSRYPGLDREVERLSKRRDQQVVAEQKARLAEEIDRYLGLADYEKAMERIRDALSEYPGDREFLALEELAGKGLEEAVEAQRLLTEARGQFDDGNTTLCLETLRRARDLDRRDVSIRALLVDTMLAEARRQLDLNWHKSDLLVQQASDIDPSNPQISQLRADLAEKKRMEMVEGCVADARQAQMQGDLTAALGHVDRGLSLYRHDPRLSQLRTTLERAAAEKLRQTRERDLEEARTIARTMGIAPELDTREALEKRADEIRESYPEDDDFLSIFETMRVPRPKPEVEAVAAPPPVPAAQAKPAAPEPAQAKPVRPEPPPPKKPKPSQPKAPSVFVTRLKAAMAGAGKTAADLWTAITAPAMRKPLFIGGGALLGCGAVVVAILLWPTGEKTDGLRVTVPVVVSPPEASVRIDGEPVNVSGGIELEPAAHTIEVSLEGYETVRREFEVTPLGIEPLQIALTPLPPVVRVVSDLRSGQVLLDDVKIADLLEDGQFLLENPPEGNHTLRVVSGRLNAAIPFTVTPGAAPAIGEGAAANELKMVAVSSYRGQARVHSFLGAAALELDGSPGGEAGPGGVEIAGFGSGPHQLTLRARAIGEHLVPLDVGSNPSLIVSLASDRNVGTIAISANEEDYQVFVDDRPQRVRDRDGKATLPNLDAGSYTVRIEKPDYRVEPESQTVEVRKGRLATAEFTFTPLPREASLVAEGVPLGMVITVGDREFPAPADGRITRNDIPPGEHAIQLRRPGYRTRTLQRKFDKRQTVRLNRADLELEVAMATIRFTKLSPPSTKVTIQQSGQVAVAYRGPANVTGTQSIQVPFGDYNVTGSAEGYQDDTKTLNIRAEETFSLPFELRPAPREVKRVELPKPVGMEGWKPAWAMDDGWHTRRGGGVVTLPVPSAVGSYRFTVRRPSGGIFGGSGDPVEWVANWVDKDTYVLFKLTRDALEVWEAKGGPEKKLGQAKHRLEDKTEYTVEVQVRPDSIKCWVREKGAEKVSGTYTGANLGQGKFGFRTNGNAQLRIKDFLFTPAP